MVHNLKYRCFNLLILLYSTFYTINAQTVGAEFPIATGPDSTFATAFAENYDRFLIVMRKDKPNDGADIICQFVSKSTNLPIGEPIKIGSTVFSYKNMEHAFPQAASDKDNFLVVWSDSIFEQATPTSVVYGCLIQGQEVGIPFEITRGKLVSGFGTLHYNTKTGKFFLASYNNNGLYGHFISVHSGVSITTIQISNLKPRAEYSLAFGDTSYLACWVNDDNDYEVCGQLIGESGAINGPSSGFLIDGSTDPSDNPLYVTYAGTRFIVLFNEENLMDWSIYARFVYEDGTVKDEKPLICRGGALLLPHATVNGTELLATWTRIPRTLNLDSCNVIGRFFDLDCQPIKDEFTIFSALTGKAPCGNLTTYTNGFYYVFTNRVDIKFIPPDEVCFVNGDVYGVTINGPTSVKDRSTKPARFELSQNYPNPFNPETKFRFSIPDRSYVTLKIYNLVGQEVATIVAEELTQGTYTREWKADGTPSGVYLCQLKAGNLSETRKIILMK